MKNYKKKDRKKRSRQPKIKKHNSNSTPEAKPVSRKIVTASKDVIVIRKRPAKKKPEPEPRPTPKKKKKNPIEKVPVMFKKHVYKRIEAMLPKPPFTIGIKSEIIKRLLDTGEYEGKRTRVRICVDEKMRIVCSQNDYYKAIINSCTRYGFDGNTGHVTTREKRQAKEKLDRGKYERARADREN